MKIFYNNAVYVHLRDIAQIMAKKITMPSSMYMTYVGLGDNSIDVNETNSFDFRIFRKPEEIDFFRGLDWILDLKEVENLSADELQGFRERLSREGQNYKSEAVAAFLDFRNGKISMKFPEGTYVKKWVEDSPKGLKGFFSKAFGKK